MKRFLPVSIIILALFFVLPLFQPGYIPTHDGEFSIIRIWQYAKMLSAGHFPPRWAPDLNSGYGVPLFTFYYPLPYFLGSILHFLGLSLVDAFKVILGFFYILASLFCFAWLTKLFSRFAASAGTIFFMTVPYWFVDIYVRGSVGEVLALCAFMGALAAVEYGYSKLLIIFTAALILSHNISAVLFMPLLVGYIWMRKRQLLWTQVLSLGLSAFFWIPAIFEQPFVVGLSNFDFRDHFPDLAQLLIPSWGTGFSQPGWPEGEMSQQLGVGVVALFGLSFVYFRKILVWPLVISFSALFLMLESSIPIWNLIQLLWFIQYPWRLLAIFIPLSAFLGAYIAGRNPPLAILTATFSLFVSFPYVHPVIYASRPDEYYLSKHEFTDGTTTVGNGFSTIWLPWQKERPTNLFVKESNGAIIANIAYYPGWTAFVDGQKVEVKQKEGRIQFTAPKGAKSYELRFMETPMRLVSDIISLLSLFWLII